MSQYERLATDLTRWLVNSSDIELIVGDIQHTMDKGDISDEEYLDLMDIHEAAKLALDGWSKADQLLAKLTVAQARRRANSDL